MHLTYWLISTQVDSAGNVLAGVRPSTKDDALRLLDKAYADAGTIGGQVFRKEYQHNGLWGGVLLFDGKEDSGGNPLWGGVL